MTVCFGPILRIICINNFLEITDILKNHKNITTVRQYYLIDIP